MKHRIVKYSVAWIALAILIASATIGLLVNFRDLEPGRYDYIFLSFSWVLVVASGFYLFNYASKEILRRDIEKKEEEEAAKKTVKKREKKQTVTESESLDIDPVARKILRRISPENPAKEWGKELLDMLSSELEIMSGVFYFRNKKNIFESVATYAIAHAHEPYSFKEGEGLSGQAVSNRSITVYKTIPDEYSEVCSGLGKVKPTYLAIVPIVVKEKCIAIFECAGFKFSVPELEHLFQILSREIASTISAAGEANKE